MYRTHAIGVALLTTASFLFVGLVYAQEDGVKRENVPVVEKINVRDSIRDTRPEMEVVEDSVIELDEIEGIKNVQGRPLNHDSSRSNSTNSRIDTNEDESDAGDTEVQRERKKPGRVTYGNITLERAFNTDSPYQDEAQEIEATQKVFLFGLIPMQVSVVARVSKNEEIEVTQRPWYAFLLWR